MAFEEDGAIGLIIVRVWGICMHWLRGSDGYTCDPEGSLDAFCELLRA